MSFAGRESIHFSTSGSTSTDHMISRMISRSLGSTASAGWQGRADERQASGVEGGDIGASRRDDRPLANTYWVDPGRFAAGEYPGAWDRGEAAARLRTLLQAGIDCFIDLTQRDEGLEPYAGIAAQEASRAGFIARQRIKVGSPGCWFNRPCCSRWAGAT